MALDSAGVSLPIFMPSLALLHDAVQFEPHRRIESGSISTLTPV